MRRLLAVALAGSAAALVLAVPAAAQTRSSSAALWAELRGVVSSLSDWQTDLREMVVHSSSAAEMNAVLYINEECNIAAARLDEAADVAAIFNNLQSSADRQRTLPVLAVVVRRASARSRLSAQSITHAVAGMHTSALILEALKMRDALNSAATDLSHFTLASPGK